MKEKRITIRFTEEEYEAIEKAARLLNVQISTFARTAIQDSLTERHENRRLLANQCLRANSALGLAQRHVEAVLEQLGIPNIHVKI